MNKKIRRMLLSSVLTIIMCFAMIIGSTFAWFTDGVTSNGNIIKTGTLKVGMYWAQGTENPETVTWKDAESGAIFYNDKWEPGYVEVRHIKIANEGTLALKYQLNVIPAGQVSTLSEVIDVYYVDPAVQVTSRAMLTNENKLGTLKEVLAQMSDTASGTLEAEKSDIVTLALAMRTNVGNEYQNLSIGSSFSIQLRATQYGLEADGFDDQYDTEAQYPAELMTSSFKLLSDPRMTMRIEGEEVVLSYDGVVQNRLPKELVTINGNVLTVVNAGQYTGTYTVHESGYLEKDGEIIAKSETTWVDIPPTDNGYVIIHNDGVYSSSDGNTINESLGSFEQIGQGLNALIAQYIGDTEAFYEEYDYRFEEYDGEFTVGNFFDFIAFGYIDDENKQILDDNGHYTGSINYYGSTATIEKSGDSLAVKANWAVTDVDGVIETKAYLVTENGRQQLSETDVIEGGIYELVQEEKYYHNGVETENIIFFEDYALYFEDGMTYREWMHEHNFQILNDNYSGDALHGGIYVPEEYLDVPCDAGRNNKLAIPPRIISNSNLGYYDVNNFTAEYIWYSAGKSAIKRNDFNKMGYEYAGMAWARGVETDGRVYADEIYNYLIEDLGIDPYSDEIVAKGAQISFYTAFKAAEGTTVVDISQYVSKSGDDFVIDYDALAEAYGFDDGWESGLEEIPVYSVYDEGEYLVNCLEAGISAATGVTFYYNGVVYTGFAS